MAPVLPTVGSYGGWTRAHVPQNILPGAAPRGRTLNREPFTLNLNPETPNPKPQTPNPEPCTLNQDIWCFLSRVQVLLERCWHGSGCDWQCVALGGGHSRKGC
jgi:hypothetical protein